MKISVIVPVYNESDLAAELIDHLAALDAWEVIVVDGGSTDDTWQRLHELGGSALRRYQTDTGRARQMNHGAVHASGDVLLFLHADTRLPRNAMSLIVNGLRQRRDCRWGRFDVRFDRPGQLLRLVARAMNLRSAWTSICTGDQALFVLRREFVRIGGYAPVALMEDVDLSRRLKRESRPLRIREPVVTSSRRWRTNGAWRTVGLMWWLRWLYWWGVPASALATRYYGKP